MQIFEALRGATCRRGQALRRFLFAYALFILSPVAVASAAITPEVDERESIKQQFVQIYSAYETYVARNDYEKAAIEAKQALELGESLFEADSENLANLTFNYGVALWENAGSKEATPVLKTALKRYQNIYGKNSVELIPILMYLGRHYRIGKRYLTRALSIGKSEYGEKSRDYGLLLIDAGSYQLASSYTYSRSARNNLEEGYEILLKEAGRSSADFAWASFNIGKYELGVGRPDAAREYFLDALKAFENDDENHTNRLELSTHAFLVEAYEKLDQSDLATTHCLAIGRMTPFDPEQEYLPIFRTSPKYPYSAQSKGQEGRARIRFTVDELGIVRNPEIAELKGPRSIGVESLETISEWRYAPRFVDGKAVATEGVETILTFEMED